MVESARASRNDFTARDASARREIGRGMERVGYFLAGFASGWAVRTTVDSSRSLAVNLPRGIRNGGQMAEAD